MVNGSINGQSIKIQPMHVKASKKHTRCFLLCPKHSTKLWCLLCLTNLASFGKLEVTVDWINKKSSFENQKRPWKVNGDFKIPKVALSSWRYCSDNHVFTNSAAKPVEYQRKRTSIFLLASSVGFLLAFSTSSTSWASPRPSCTLSWRGGPPTCT